MRTLLLRLFFGTDDLVTYMAKLITLRTAAVKRHKKNKEFAAKLEVGCAELRDLKSEYTLVRSAVEGAYKLELN